MPHVANSSLRDELSFVSPLQQPSMHSPGNFPATAPRFSLADGSPNRPPTLPGTPPSRTNVSSGVYELRTACLRLHALKDSVQQKAREVEDIDAESEAKFTLPSPVRPIVEMVKTVFTPPLQPTQKRMPLSCADCRQSKLEAQPGREPLSHRLKWLCVWALLVAFLRRIAQCNQYVSVAGATFLLMHVVPSKLLVAQDAKCTAPGQPERPASAPPMTTVYGLLS